MIYREGQIPIRFIRLDPRIIFSPHQEHILTNEFLPHQGLEDSPEVHQRKSIYLAAIVVKLLGVYLGIIQIDDRDDYSLKRIETTGGLFALLFRQLFRQYLKMLHLQFTRLIDTTKNLNVPEILNAKKITAGMKYAISTGNWGIQKQSSQTLERNILVISLYTSIIYHNIYFRIY